jgi:hypothetical protein
MVHRAPKHKDNPMKDLRSGSDAATNHNNTTNNLTLQELASAGPSGIESFGPEPGGQLVRVDILRHASSTLTFKLRCGLAIAGGES